MGITICLFHVRDLFLYKENTDVIQHGVQPNLEKPNIYLRAVFLWVSECTSEREEQKRMSGRRRKGTRRRTGAVPSYSPVGHLLRQDLSVPALTS